MPLETLFSLAGGLAMAGWIVLAVAPRWALGSHLVAPVVVTGLLGLAYAVLIVRGLPGAEGGFGSLAEVAKLFQDETLLLAGWIHYLAFDLFVGAWEVRDAQRLGIHHGLVLPCLLLTLMLGPVGLLLYLALRSRKEVRVA
ncbi:MAG: ABA4-like family protein [Planctomycetota bacterium]|nr:ABA4-like family protein [Planctomycetota bacterium]